MPKETKQEAMNILLEMIWRAIIAAVLFVALVAWIGPEKSFPGLYLDSEVGSSEKHKQ